MASRILQSNETGMYLGGWDKFGQPKFVADKSLANTMNFPTASRVADNLKDIFHKGEFTVKTV